MSANGWVMDYEKWFIKKFEENSVSGQITKAIIDA